MNNMRKPVILPILVLNMDFGSPDVRDDDEHNCIGLVEISRISLTQYINFCLEYHHLHLVHVFSVV